MNLNYVCKNCKEKVILKNDYNVIKLNDVVNNEKLEYTFFICDKCKTVEVVNIDNATTKKLLSAEVFAFANRNQFKSIKKRLDKKRQALLIKHTNEAKEAFKTKYKGSAMDWVN